MSLLAPLALLALVALPAIWWMHRAARPEGDRPYSAFFLIVGGEGGARGRKGLRAPLLMAARLLAAAALVLAAVGLQGAPERGTLVITAGPFTPDPRWEAPITVIRAGSPPTVVAASAESAEAGPIEPVVSPPEWGPALALGRSYSPEGRLVYVDDRGDFAPFATGAGAALVEGAVQVDVQIAPGLTPQLAVGDQRLDMAPGDGLWRIVAPLPSGPAEIRVAEYEGGQGYPLCLPDRSPLAVDAEGWPEALARLLPLMGVTEIPPGGAAKPGQRRWRPGPGPEITALSDEIWAPFAPAVTWIDFIEGDRVEDGPLRLAGDLPNPEATARRWRPLKDPGAPTVWVGAAVVGDVKIGPEGRRRRFGFLPRDTDLPETAGWPALISEAAEADRAGTGRCRVHRAGSPLILAAESAVEITSPGGRRWTIQPAEDGAGRSLARIEGLDAMGHYKIEAGGEAAWIAVTPQIGAVGAGVPEVDEDVVLAPAVIAAPYRAGPLLVALILCLAAIWRSRRWGHVGPWLTPLLIVLAWLGPQWWPSAPVGVRVAVDTSASMPEAGLQNVLGMVEAALGERVTLRVEGGPAIRWSGPPGTPLHGAPAGATQHGPLVQGLQRQDQEGGAQGEGAVVLLTDGRALDGPVTPGVPILPVPVGVDGPDVGILSARTAQTADTIFVEITLLANVDGPVKVEIGERQREVKLKANTPRHVQISLPVEAAGPEGALEIVLEPPRDVWSANDRWPAPVELAAPPVALSVGAGAMPWLQAAGFEARQIPIEALTEGPEIFRDVAIVALHDQPVEALPAAAVAALSRWASAGGVILLGGRRRAYGPGGWAGAAIEALSPLRADPEPPAGARIGVALLLDRSGSMSEEAGGVGPAGLARLAGSIARGLGGPGDQLAIVAFGMSADVLLRPTPMAQVDPALLETPSIIRGGTTIGPAMLTATGLLETVDVDERVVIVITDGRFVDEGEPDIPPRLKRSAIQVVAVLVGPEPRLEPLSGLAEITGGQVVLGEGDSLPRLITEGLLKAARGDLLAAGGLVTPTAAWQRRVPVSPPPVDARIRVAPAPGARILARAGGDPFVAERPWGLGRVIAVATDQWQGSPGLWRGLLSPALAPRPSPARLQISDEGRLQLDFDPREGMPGPGRLTTAAGQVDEILWQLEAPGRASAALPEGPVEILHVHVPLSAGAWSGRITRPPARELRQIGVDDAALQLQAELTGGQVIRSPETLLDALKALPSPPAGRGRLWIILGALLALLAEVALWSGLWKLQMGRRGMVRK